MFQFSIGDAVCRRCSISTTTHRGVSILYWRCAAGAGSLTVAKNVRFNSLLEMPPHTQQSKARRLLQSFNSLLEMPAQGDAPDQLIQTLQFQFSIGDALLGFLYMYLLRVMCFNSLLEMPGLIVF